MKERLKVGDVVKHFKRETVPREMRGLQYLYIIKDVAEHTETRERLVIYQALYPDTNGDLRTWARPYDDFMGKVDKEKHPQIEQSYRFEKVIQI